MRWAADERPGFKPVPAATVHTRPGPSRWPRCSTAEADCWPW
jgi:hypothetical protein